MMSDATAQNGQHTEASAVSLSWQVSKPRERLREFNVTASLWAEILTHSAGAEADSGVRCGAVLSVYYLP